MRELHVTPFDKATKKCTGPSLLLGTAIPDREAARAAFGGNPASETPNTMIFDQPNGQALCVSWIRFQHD